MCLCVCVYVCMCGSFGFVGVRVGKLVIGTSVVFVREMMPAELFVAWLRCSGHYLFCCGVR